MILFTDILEECAIRSYDYPGPITIKRFESAMDHAFGPIPDINKVFVARDLASRPYLLKFGDPKWLKLAVETGAFRIAPASFYESADLNHARRDTELQRILKPNPRDNRAQEFLKKNGITEWLPEIRMKSTTDYLLFSLCGAYSARMFGDFAATACLVIHEPVSFSKRLLTSVEAALNDFEINLSPVSYFDPVRIDPDMIDIRFFKPFRHAYQAELRLTCTPKTPTPKLNPINIDIGNLADCAELVDLSTHPAIVLPPDPKNAPIQRYGDFSKGDAMVNQLPDVSKMGGISLYKEGHPPKDWYFIIQYTDDDNKLQEIKVPLVDGLYLLNLLRTAEKDQHLDFWNRE